MHLCTFDIQISIFQGTQVNFQENNFRVILLILKTNISYYLTWISNYISDAQSKSRSRNLATSKMNFFKSTVDAFQLLTIVAKNSFLNVTGFRDLFLDHYADVQKMYAFEF